MSRPADSVAGQHRKKVLPLVLLAVLLMTGSLFLTNKKESDVIVVTFPSGKQLEAEVADTPEKLLFGLAFRDGLPQGSGMLYIFETSALHRVHTKGYKIRVDMIWADESRHVVHLHESAEPCSRDPCPLYGPPPQKARYIIQSAAGFIREERLTPGAELKFTLRL